MLVLLKKAYYNRKPVENPRKRDKETCSTQEGHEAQLKREMMARKPDKKKIKALLTVSSQKRRKWIESLTGKQTVRRVLDDFPGFKDSDLVSEKVR